MYDCSLSKIYSCAYTFVYALCAIKPFLGSKCKLYGGLVITRHLVFVLIDLITIFHLKKIMVIFVSGIYGLSKHLPILQNSWPCLKMNYMFEQLFILGILQLRMYIRIRAVCNKSLCKQQMQVITWALVITSHLVFILIDQILCI